MSRDENPLLEESNDKIDRVGLKSELSAAESDSSRRNAVKKAFNPTWEWRGNNRFGGYGRIRGALERHLRSFTGSQNMLKEEELAEIIKPQLRGFFGERLSGALQLNECATCFVSNTVTIEDLESVYVVDPNIFPPITDKKEDASSRDVVLQATKPVSLEWFDESFKQAYGRPYVDPDALITREQENIFFPIGTLEMFSYTPEEFGDYLRSLRNNLNGEATDKEGDKTRIFRSRWLQNVTGPESKDNTQRGTKLLGLDLEGHLDFVRALNDRLDDELVRNNLDFIPFSSTDALVVLRFPKDISNEGLAELGEILTSAGYKVIIQKIPFTFEEINHIAKTTIATDYKEGTLKDEVLVNSSEQRRPLTERVRSVYIDLANKSTEW